jgi:beta-mannosidase
MARATITGSREPQVLDGRWEIAALPHGLAATPDDLAVVRPDWIACAAAVPAAAALRTAGAWDLDHPRDFDADDWWYRCRFPFDAVRGTASLRFEGLATTCDAWLNGHHILRSDNMFVTHVVDVGHLLREDNVLTLRFAALATLLASPPRRPRPRWRTGLVAHQNLRWHRTSLLGRMPGWCPPVAPVGPWRPILIDTAPLAIEHANVDVDIDDDTGVVHVHLRTAWRTDAARLSGGDDLSGTLTIGEWSAPLTCERLPDGRCDWSSCLQVPHPDRWWPHTHGTQPLYDVRVTLTGAIDATVDLGRIGFRTIGVDRGADGNGFGLVVNGVPVFCRGVCWTPIDIARLSASRADYREALRQLRDAGVNMVRVAGTMTYEADAFHDTCDELGILVWQDFMFARMDYPWSDEAFRATVSTEVSQILEALQSRPSLAVLCGSSEVDQQAAMLGLPPSQWASAERDALLAEVVRIHAPAAAWIPTSPGGSALPFQVDTAVSHYYGVGAYRRPFDDARRAGVRFASECLAFSNVPDAATVALLVPDGELRAADAAWKRSVPRDPGVDWDFEDVRDHYVRTLFGVEPGELSFSDPGRYLAFGRLATGEAMLRTFAEWRRPGSSCRGGLVWLARDLAPGAGWGIVDATGRPKAAYWYLKRALAPVALLAADEGLNGLWLHAVNDTPRAIDADLRVALYLDGTMRGEAVRASAVIAARASQSIHVDALLGGFRDLTYAYRFGPLGHDVVSATLRDRSTGNVLATSHYFPHYLPAASSRDPGLTARLETGRDGYTLVLDTERFAHAIEIDMDGFLPDDNYLSLEPGESKRVRLHPRAGAHATGTVAALNSWRPVPIAVAEPVDVS